MAPDWLMSLFGRSGRPGLQVRAVSKHVETAPGSVKRESAPGALEGRKDGRKEERQTPEAGNGFSPSGQSHWGKRLGSEEKHLLLDAD